MAITQVDKMKIIKFFRETAFGEIYYDDLVACVGKKSKVTDVEFLTFFVTYVIENLKKDSPSLSLLKKMVSALSYFIDKLHENNVELEIELVNKLYAVRESFEQYLVKTNSDRDEEIENLILEFENDLNNFYPKISASDVDVERIMVELENLRAELSEREKEIENLNLLCKKKDKSIDSKKKDIVRLSTRLDSSHNKRKELEDKIKELEGLIIELRNFISVLESQLKDGDEKYSLLNDLKDKIQNDYFELKATIKSLRKELEKRERELQQIQEEEKTKIIIPSSDDIDEDMKNKIEGLIIQKMLLGPNTIDDLVQHILENGYSVSRREVRKHLMNIKDKMNLSPNIPEDLKISTLDEVNSYEIIVPENCSSFYDLMIVSDFHLTSFDKEVIQDMELINDYCECNGINMILNAGDFFSLNRTRRKQSISICKKLIERVIEKYPSSSGITHAIMGGNHDKDFLEYVDDPIATLVNARDDFINLGYGHCKISFGGSVSILDTIGLHHPNRRFPETINHMFNTEKIKSSIKSYYVSNNLSSSDVYVDILGHIHKSGLDIPNGICIIPSYRKDRVVNGAWHLKIYFGEDNHISNIVFIPVIKQKKLVPVTEVVYSKKLTIK